MNKKHYLSAIFIFAIFVLTTISAKSQNNSDTIRMEKKGLGYVYYKDEALLNFKQAMQLTHSTPEAYRLMEKSNNMRVASYIFGFAGGLSLGFSLGHALGSLMVGNPINETLFYPMLGGGAALIGIGFGLEVGANKKTKKAIAVYNNSIKQKNTQTLDLGISANGIMLKLNF